MTSEHMIFIRSPMKESISVQQKLPPTFGPTGLVAHVLRPESRAALDVGLDQLQSFKREQLVSDHDHSYIDRY